MTLLKMSAAGGVVILAVTAVRALALDRLPKRTFTALWAVAVLRLLVPVSVPSPVSVYRLIADRPAASETAPAETASAPAQAAEWEPVTPREADADASVPLPPESPAPEAAEPERSIPWLTVLWAAGALGCAVYFAAGYIAALGRFREAVEVQDPYVDRWRDSYGLRRRVSVRLSGRVKGPATYGLLRPVILLSADVDWHDRQKMWLILCHEYTHICRLDGLKKLILTVTACLHWFNPLVWLMLLLADRDLELACDEKVLRTINGDGRADYARTLLDMAGGGRPPAPLVSFFNKSALAERIRAIMKTRKPSVLSGAAGVLLALAVTAVFACSAPAAKAAPVADEASAAIVHHVDYTPPSPSPAPTDPEATARPRPTQNEVLAARQEALAGMTQADIDRLTSTIAYQNQLWENMYLQDILTRLEDPEDLAWNYFDKTGEIEVSSEPCYSYHYEGELTDEQIVQVMEEEELNYFEFCEKYGVFEEQDSFVTFNEYSVDKIVSMLEDMRDTVQNEALRTDLTYLSRQIVLARRTHNMWYASQMFKLLHDLDYYLLRYGPVDQPSTRPGESSIVGVYYGMLTILGADHGEGQDPDWQPADPPPSPTPAVHHLTAEDVAAQNTPAPMLPDEKAFITEVSREWVLMGYEALTYEEFAEQYDQPLVPLNGAPERYKNVGCVYVWSDPASPNDTMFVQLLYDWEGQSAIYVQQWRTEDGDSNEPFFYHTDCDEMGVPHRELGDWFAWRAGLDGVTGGVGVNMQLRSVEDIGEENCRLTLLALWNGAKEEFS